jgi:flagellin-like protein
MRKLFSNKRAVSPVIATVLMILVTMVGMTILFAFVTSYSQFYKEGVGSQVLELITVEDVWIKADSYHSVQITVYNAGKIDSQITSVYVNGLALAKDSVVGSDFNLAGLTAEVGKHLTFTVYGSAQIPLNPIQTYTFTIGTKTGSTFEATNTP